MDNPLVFEWDSRKAQINIEKHGISFEEAQSVFYDPKGILIYDPEHSLSEERFVLIGASQNLHILTVCHCYRKSDAVIRIISARKATVRETEQYNKRGEML